MSIVAAPEWLIHFEDGSTFNDSQGSWSDVSEHIELDGLWVYQTKKLVTQIHLYAQDEEGQVHRLVAPTPRPFFAYKRSFAPIVSSPTHGYEPTNNERRVGIIWCYSCFGYLLGDDYRVTLILNNRGVETIIAPRSLPFLP